MKIKMLKKLISVVCAAMMTTSCVVGSVGAVKAFPGANSVTRDNVLLMNEQLDELIADMSRMKDKLNDWLKDKRIQKEGTVQKILKSFYNRVCRLIGDEKQGTVGLSTLRDKYEAYCNDELIILGEKINGFYEYVDSMCKYVNRMEVDYDNDKVFVRQDEASGINLKEGNEAKEELCPNGTHENVFLARKAGAFGANSVSLAKGIKDARKFIEDSETRKMTKLVNDISDENRELSEKVKDSLQKFQDSWEKYCKTMKDFGIEYLAYDQGILNFMQEKVGFEGQNGCISTNRIKEFFKDKQSMKQARKDLMAFARAFTETLPSMYAMKGKNYIVNGAIDRINKCVDEMSSEEHKNNPNKYLANKDYKECNIRFLDEYKRLKLLIELIGDKAGNVNDLLDNLLREFSEELADSYVFNQGQEQDKQEQDKFNQKVSNAAQQVRDRLKEIADAVAAIHD